MSNSEFSKKILDDGTRIEWITGSLTPSQMEHLATVETAEDAAKLSVDTYFVWTPRSALNTQVAGSHYKHRKIQPIEYCEANRLGACESAIIKYITRWREKGGMKDLEKIKHYVDLLIETEQKYHKWNPQNNTWNHEGDSQNYD